MKTVLLTCGRGVYALTLARAFRAAGCRVLVAESWACCASRFSNAVDRFFHVPPPATETDEWVAALLRIVDAEAVDLIVPVYEEVFHLAKALDGGPGRPGRPGWSGGPNRPNVFASDFQTLITLHNKWLFNQKAASLGLPVPETVLLSSRADLERAFERDRGREKVFKGAYSRFASHTVVRPADLESLAEITPMPASPWVAQEFLPGRPFATFSIAHRGRITAHATYATDFCHKFGPTVVYRRAEHPGIFEWVRRFVEAVGYTGQIGFDFIEYDAEKHRVAAIECNPRLTGGLYLLKDDPRFASAYWDPALEPIEATPDRSYAFRFWLLLTALQHTKSFPGFREWFRYLVSARATNAFLPSDPLPILLRPFLAVELFYRCFKQGQNVRALATSDIEWSEDRELLPSILPLSEHRRSA